MALWVHRGVDRLLSMHGRAAGLEELLSAGDTLQYSALSSLLLELCLALKAKSQVQECGRNNYQDVARRAVQVFSYGLENKF